MLYSGMEMHQLIKIGTLVEHFSKHQKENRASTFLDLLVQHYTPNSSEENDADKSDDLKLPFKSFVGSGLSPFIVSRVFIQVNTQPFSPDCSYDLPRNEYFDNAFSPYVFRPPNTCV